MWYPMEYKAWALRGLLVAAGLLSALPASAAVIDVCATCTHTTLDTAFAAAVVGDTIILNGPDDPLQPAEVYTLTTNLVIDATKDGLEIRAKSTARPDKIVIQGTGLGPVITVEQDASFEALGFTVTGGTTGILAMQGSNVDIRRCLIDAIPGIGVDCSNPEEVYIAGSVIRGSGGDAVRLSLGGELNMTQCTLLGNGGFGVNAVAGVATVASCLIYDSGAGLDGTATSLTVGGNWVTDAAGAVLPMPAGVTDAFPIVDVLDPFVTFELDAGAFPGEIDNLFTIPLTGQTAETLSDVTPLSRDFENVLRSTTDPRVGAHENGVSATTAAWIECEIVQRGQVRDWVGEGPVTIYLLTENLSLVDSLLWIANPTATGGITVDNTATPNRLGGFIVETPSVVDTNYGFVDLVIDRAEFVTGFPDILPGVDTTDYEIYVQPDTVPLNSVDVLDQPEALGSPAEEGRIFGLDTLPPLLITDRDFLADQYATGASLTDGGAIDPGPWSAPPLLGDAGANAGYLNFPSGDPSIFYDGPTPKPNMGIVLRFEDQGSGFEVDGLPNGRAESTLAGKIAALYDDYAGVPGMAWWDPNEESTVELLSSPATLTVTYTNTGGTILDTAWSFAGVEHDLETQWHAIANIRVTDLAGNEATLDPSFENFIPLKPLHMWWFPEARGELRRGPSGGKESNPVFTWGMFRGVGGQDPKDPQPCFSTVRWRLWGATAPGVPTTSWVDLSGGLWSDWMLPSVKTIGLDTLFDPTTRLRDMMTGPDDSEYLIAVQGYDEAGNLQNVPVLGNLTTVADLVDTVGGTYNVDFRRWIAPGVDESMALDTKVQARFWYNPGNGGRDRALDGGERDFGSATRIPLPPVVPCQRVEAGFTVSMEYPASVTTSVGVYYEVFEDERLVADGTFYPGSVPAADGPFHFVFPSDLMFGAGAIPAWLAPSDADTDDLFLNIQPLCTPIRERLGDEGDPDPESGYRQRDVKYRVLFATDLGGVRDTTPASVEFTVTVDRGLKDDQPIKSFSKE